MKERMQNDERRNEPTENPTNAHRSTIGIYTSRTTVVLDGKMALCNKRVSVHLSINRGGLEVARFEIDPKVAN